jgi:hypothetical protein
MNEVERVRPNLKYYCDIFLDTKATPEVLNCLSLSTVSDTK